MRKPAKLILNLTLILSGLLACKDSSFATQKAVPGQQPPVHPHKVTRSEQEVLTLVAEDMRKWVGFKDLLERVAKRQRTPQLVTETHHVDTYIAETYILTDIANGRSAKISRSLVMEMQRRNPDTVPLLGLLAPAPYKLVSPAEVEAQRRLDESHRPEYNFSAFSVYFALPAFDAHRHQVLVYFYFDQGVGGMHGGGYGYYHLIRRGAHWRIHTKYITFLN